MPRIPPELARSQTLKGSDGIAHLGQVATISKIDVTRFVASGQSFMSIKAVQRVADALTLGC